MLRFLNIANFALIDGLQVEFHSGLNVLSGETGSGKSIIIDALGLLLGERGSTEMIRSGEERAFVEGVFDFQGNKPLVEVMSDSGIETTEEELIIRREISLSGRGRIFINNQVASLSLLKAIQPHIVDIHGQGDQQSLLSSETHLNLLDAYAGIGSLRADIFQVYEEIFQLVKTLEENRQSESERLKSLDMIDFQLTEIDQAALSESEDTELEMERNKLANAEKLAVLSREIYQCLYEDENSAQSRLAAAQKRMTELVDLDPGFSAQLDQLTSAKYVLDDVAFTIGEYCDGVQASPARLQFVEDRIADIRRLKRKYGASVKEILSFRDKLLEQKNLLLHSEERGKDIVSRLRIALEKYKTIATEISHLRQSAIPKLERAITKELAAVALGAAKFSVQLVSQEKGQLSARVGNLIGASTEALSRIGKDSVEFLFTANAGEELKPLKAVASGGELSRLMLVLKTVTAPTLFPRTLIFDEIDAGIGGRVAEAVGQRLKRLSKTNQVLCITHQSQIARYADTHYLITKELNDKRTVTRLTSLDEDGRIEELVRMIGGSTATMAARKHARELLHSQ
ncbi:MAG TPA: DNA repair protein RecN [Blastocatellia bacterium]|nr:DNA repair protein RecN [Blastocatellia bacterium]